MREQLFHQIRTQLAFAAKQSQEWFRSQAPDPTPSDQWRVRLDGGCALGIGGSNANALPARRRWMPSAMVALSVASPISMAVAMVGNQWNCFTNGGAANYGFYNDQWDATVYEGKSSQLIEINSKDMAASDNDRYAGISQTTRVVPGAPYNFSLRGMIRTTNLEGDPWRYVVQVGWVGVPQGNWKDVKNWVELPWNTYYNRTEPGAFSAFQTQLVPDSEVITVFVRVWKKWGVPYEKLDVNLDAIELSGPAGRSNTMKKRKARKSITRAQVAHCQVRSTGLNNSNHRLDQTGKRVKDQKMKVQKMTDHKMKVLKLRGRDPRDRLSPRPLYPPQPVLPAGGGPVLGTGQAPARPPAGVLPVPGRGRPRRGRASRTPPRSPVPRPAPPPAGPGAGRTTGEGRPAAGTANRGAHRVAGPPVRPRPAGHGAFGYVDDWSLTPGGEQLTRIYHECDLLIAEAVRNGLFDDLDPTAVAALASAFTYETRGPAAQAARPAPWFPSARSSTAGPSSRSWPGISTRSRTRPACR